MSFKILIKPLMSESEGDNGLFITLVLKVLNNVFLLLGLTTLGNFDWLVI